MNQTLRIISFYIFLSLSLIGFPENGEARPGTSNYKGGTAGTPAISAHTPSTPPTDSSARAVLDKALQRLIMTDIENVSRNSRDSRELDTVQNNLNQLRSSLSQRLDQLENRKSQYPQQIEMLNQKVSEQQDVNRRGTEILKHLIELCKRCFDDSEELLDMKREFKERNGPYNFNLPRPKLVIHVSNSTDQKLIDEISTLLTNIGEQISQLQNPINTIKRRELSGRHTGQLQRSIDTLQSQMRKTRTIINQIQSNKNFTKEFKRLTNNLAELEQKGAQQKSDYDENQKSFEYWRRQGKTLCAFHMKGEIYYPDYGAEDLDAEVPVSKFPKWPQ